MSLLEGDLPTPAGVWASLARGVVDRRSPFGRPAIATVDPLGQAEVRTVVLRDVEPGARQLVLHSDTRAAKVAALAHQPRLAWHFWDPRPRLQLRASGPATVHTRGPMVDETWARLSVHQQRTYAAEPAPGTPLDAAGDGLPSADAAAAGRAHFCVITCTIDAFDILQLRRGGHRRCVLSWDGTAWAATWVVP